MDRRAFLAGAALAMMLATGTAFAKDKSAGEGSDGTGDAGTDAGTVKSSTTDQPGTEAQPEDATQCAAGTDCTKK